MYVYIMTNSVNTVFYIGVTNDLLRRVDEHKRGLVQGFTKKYNITKLVYYEIANSPIVAIEREKQLKRWHRDWKINLVLKDNPCFEDLFGGLVGDPETSSG
ncbi:MAG: GIY-YIG nuclease superfamily protein [Parcubacteria group bacterium ADurb.Bin192]|nr:MAG: GIY-YIG nuclease superfamily protein [Parcubacteria group bacterium ADurb.Bin192]OQB19219.1 MAG: GIY-YIG nuclease superfamily protein [Parcubacteria group bacterium ADurb.Bin192]